jgi:hypothetical protein
VHTQQTHIAVVNRNRLIRHIDRRALRIEVVKLRLVQLVKIGIGVVVWLCFFFIVVAGFGR